MPLGGCTLPLVFHRFSVVLLHHAWVMLQILISLFPWPLQHFFLTFTSEQLNNRTMCLPGQICLTSSAKQTHSAKQSTKWGKIHTAFDIWPRRKTHKNELSWPVARAWASPCAYVLQEQQNHILRTENKFLKTINNGKWEGWGCFILLLV